MACFCEKHAIFFLSVLCVHKSRQCRRVTILCFCVFNHLKKSKKFVIIEFESLYFSVKATKYMKTL
jgi:hypothetical protein